MNQETENKHRPTLLSRDELRDIHVKLGRLDEKMDRVLEDRKRIDDLSRRTVSLEMFQSQIKVWGIVAGALWSLFLTIIGLQLWST